VAYELAVLIAAPRAAILTAVDTLATDRTVLGHVGGDKLVAPTGLVGAADRKPAPVTSLSPVSLVPTLSAVELGGVLHREQQPDPATISSACRLARYKLHGMSSTPTMET
jgi:hypothetical protein